MVAVMVLALAVLLIAVYWAANHPPPRQPRTRDQAGRALGTVYPEGSRGVLPDRDPGYSSQGAPDRRSGPG